MSFENRHYFAAENELNERKARNERRLSSNEREISAKHPEIYKIHRDIISTAANLIQLISDHSPDFERKLDELETENLRLQAQLKQELVKKGYAPDYLEMTHICKLCKDTGVINGRRCECFMDVVRRAAAEELNNNSPLKLCKFSDFSLRYYDDKKTDRSGLSPREIMAENLEFCRNYAENFHLPCNGIVMRGGTGLGKTHLSLSIAGEVIKKGYSVIYGSAPDLFRKAEQEHFNRQDGNTVETLLSADLLILDDIGAEFESKFYCSVFYNILNNRMNAAKPTIISTNCDLNELLSRYGDRIVSRLQTMDMLMFEGVDVRIIRSREPRI